MKQHYNIKENLPKLSSEQINKHQNFDDLFAKFQEMETKTASSEGKSDTPVRELPTKTPSWLVKYGVGAILALAASMLLVFMLQQTFMMSGSEAPAEQIAEILNLESPLKTFEKPFSNLVVNSAEKGEVLQYQSGSKIIVPASAFIDEKGNPVTGKVDIQYREFNDHVDMFLAAVPKELDKHQNLQSVGMMEIKGFQEGKPVFLSMDKTLEVELKSKVLADISTNDLNVYVYSKQQDIWEKAGSDKVERSTATVTQNTTLTDAQLLEKAENSLASSKPLEPIKPGVPNNMQVFDFDIDVNQFPELKSYHGALDFMVNKGVIADATFDTIWNSMNMVRKGENKYELVLSYEDNNGKSNRRFEVFPAITSTRASEKQYRKDLETYNTKKAQWEGDVLAAVERIKQEQTTGTDWVDIINRFSIHRFGLWNCGKTLEMPDAKQIGAQFIDENGQSLELNKLFITDKDQQLYYFASNANNQLKYNTKADNLIWALTDEKELLVAVANTNKDDQYTFQMKAMGVVESEADVRGMLVF